MFATLLEMRLVGPCLYSPEIFGHSELMHTVHICTSGAQNLSIRRGFVFFSVGRRVENGRQPLIA